MLYEVYENIWEEETIPEDWKESHFVKIPKRGDLGDYSNYTGITMLSVPGKFKSLTGLSSSDLVPTNGLKEK